MRDALAWYIVVQVGALAVWPIVSKALAPLEDRGWAAAKAAGVLAVAWLTWLVCMLTPTPFTRPTLLVILVAGGVAAWAWQVRAEGFASQLDWLRSKRGLVLVLESAFLGAFVLFAVLRAHEPAI